MAPHRALPGASLPWFITWLTQGHPRPPVSPSLSEGRTGRTGEDRAGRHSPQKASRTLRKMWGTNTREKSTKCIPPPPSPN